MAICPNTHMPPRLLSTREAGGFLGISVRTLEKHRTYGTGPTYRKIGGRVLYALHDLEAWIEIGARKIHPRQHRRHGFPGPPADAARAG